MKIERNAGALLLIQKVSKVETVVLFSFLVVAVAGLYYLMWDLHLGLDLVPMLLALAGGAIMIGTREAFRFYFDLRTRRLTWDRSMFFFSTNGELAFSEIQNIIQIKRNLYRGGWGYFIRLLDSGGNTIAISKTPFSLEPAADVLRALIDILPGAKVRFEGPYDDQDYLTEDLRRGSHL